MADWIEKLERITRLHQAGGLTDEEFAVQKSRILDQGRDSSKDRVPGNNTVYSPIESPPRFPKLPVALIGICALAGGITFAAYTVAGMKSDRSPDEAAATAEAVSDNVQMPPEEAKKLPPNSEFVPIVTASSIAAIDPPVVTYSPSFKCTKQLARVETLICRNRELSEKDRRLSSMFKVVLAEADISDRLALLARQRRLLADRSVCDDVYCISGWYDRVIEIYEPQYDEGDARM